MMMLMTLYQHSWALPEALENPKTQRSFVSGDIKTGLHCSRQVSATVKAFISA